MEGRRLDHLTSTYPDPIWALFLYVHVHVYLQMYVHVHVQGIQDAYRVMTSMPNLARTLLRRSAFYQQM